MAECSCSLSDEKPKRQCDTSAFIVQFNGISADTTHICLMQCSKTWWARINVGVQSSAKKICIGKLGAEAQ
jgi:hypothetical protein